MGSKPSISAPTTYAPPAPPTAANAAAVQASADARQKSLEKKGLTSTILGEQAANSGSLGGAGMFQPPSAKQNTLLGGG